MAEDEEHSKISPTSEGRPQTARKDSRKVPGGFGFDDIDDLSPSKPSFEGSYLPDPAAVAQINRVPSLDLTSLPSLPPPSDSSLVYNRSQQEASHGDEESPNQKEMERHLNDVESSFLPALSPIGMTGKPGADDTYLFDRPRSTRGMQAAMNRSTTPDTKIPRINHQPSSSPPTPANAYQTPAVPRAAAAQRDDIAHDLSINTSSLETMSSSPTAAAAARTVSRAISMASAGGKGIQNENVEYAEQELEDEKGIGATPGHNQSDTYTTHTDGRSTLRHHLSNATLNHLAADAGSTPGTALLGRRTAANKPKFLRSRYSQDYASLNIDDSQSPDGSAVTLGADYALQTGGAIPAGGLSRSSSLALSRSISLGSMASGFEEHLSNRDSTGLALDGSLAALTEEEQIRQRDAPNATDNLSPPETPRPPVRAMAAPTDTIIARHVRNVQVPEDLAKEYRSKSGAASPVKKSGTSLSNVSRNGKNLTLKEQSSTIERLSKENFDLKLKVMFLSDRLDKLSEEGVKEMISENVELKTGLAVMQRDNKALKRKVKELEKLLKDGHGRPSTARSGTSNGDPSPEWFDQEGAQEREEELIYLRERVEEYVTEIEKLRHESLARENEKRNLVEVVRNLGERQGQNLNAREEMDVWKDLLEQETARREQADEDNKRLHQEILRLRSETASGTGVPGLNHTTNIYNITKKRQVSPSRPRSGLSDRIDDRNGTFSAASTLVEELRKETEQLRHENAELRREVGAQTSMLTSRNREKERLYQEIEDLKLGQRRGGSVAGDSILERSASRAHERSNSRASAITRRTNLTDSEREDFENKNAELRDKISSLKIHNQDLQRELESCMEDFETAVTQKKAAEDLANELQEALEVAEADLLAMQSERDEALRGQEEVEIMFESLRKEAQEELDGFAQEAEEADTETKRLRTELQDTAENFSALQNEMREMSEGVVRLEDVQENNNRHIQALGKDLDEANRELEEMEKTLVDSNEKVKRLTVQQESSQGEIAFLREEQDGDKIKIGDLDAALKAAEVSLREERDRARELEQRLASERRQREAVATKEKQEVQQFINELNREASGAKDEARRLRKSLTSREVEAAEWKQRLMELENNLREALGDLSGTRSSLLNSIAKLQRELENTLRELDASKTALIEKDRLIKHRDDLLESHALESRKLADMLDKERGSHRTTRHQFETFQKTQQHTSRTLTQQEARVLELESSRQQDRRKLATLENTFKDQLNERNNLLLALWNRLSALCGSDWAHNNSLINGRALPSLEAVTNMLPGFSKNLLAAVKTIETLVGDFQSRIKSVEKDLWKDYHTLESNLDVRTKRLERLETMARSAIPGGSTSGKAEVAKLRDVNKSLKTEISSLRAAIDVQSGVYTNPSPSPSVPTGPRNKAFEKTRTSTLTRHHSASAVESLDRAYSIKSSSAASASKDGDRGGLTSPTADEEYKPDLKWQVRLQELEYKLKAEREARKLDRHSARQRIEEKTRENQALTMEMERIKVRGELGAF